MPQQCTKCNKIWNKHGFRYRINPETKTYMKSKVCQICYLKSCHSDKERISRIEEYITYRTNGANHDGWTFDQHKKDNSTIYESTHTPQC